VALTCIQLKKSYFVYRLNDLKGNDVALPRENYVLLRRRVLWYFLICRRAQRGLQKIIDAIDANEDTSVIMVAVLVAMSQTRTSKNLI
jgi:hypothetical protein